MMKTLIAMIVLGLVLCGTSFAEEASNVVKKDYFSAEKLSSGELTSSDSRGNTQSFRKWLPCGDFNVPVPDEPSFNEGDVDVYVSAFGDLVINLKKENRTYCSSIGVGWKKDGFVYGISQETKDKLLLFKISGGDSEKYIDVYKNKFLFRMSDNTKDLIVSEKPKEESGNKIKLVHHWSGDNSKINQRYYYRIMSKEKWEKVWKEHNNAPLPGIDFNKYMVIALFLGQSTNTSGINAADIQEINDVLRFRYDVESFQTRRYGVLTTPFGIFVLPKNNKVVKLEQNVQNMIGGPSRWKAMGDLETGDNVIEGPKREILTEGEYRKKMDEQWNAIMKATGDGK